MQSYPPKDILSSDPSVRNPTLAYICEQFFQSAEALELALKDRHFDLHTAIDRAKYGTSALVNANQAVVCTQLAWQGRLDDYHCRAVIVQFVTFKNETISLGYPPHLAERRNGDSEATLLLVGGGTIDVQLDSGHTESLKNPEDRIKIESGRHYTLHVHPSPGSSHVAALQWSYFSDDRPPHPSSE